MSIAAIEARIKTLLTNIEQSAANHNFLVGSLNEAKLILTALNTGAGTVQEIVSEINPVVATLSTVAPLIESL